MSNCFSCKDNTNRLVLTDRTTGAKIKPPSEVTELRGTVSCSDPLD